MSVGALYPAYASFKALETPQIDDDKQWLTYWVVFSITSSAEEVAEKVVSYLPGYYVLKVIFLVWLMLPKTRGAVLLYKNFILPLLKKYEPILDQKFLEAQLIVMQCLKELRENGTDYIKKNLLISIEKVREAQIRAQTSPLAGKIAQRMSNLKQQGIKRIQSAKIVANSKYTAKEEPNTIDEDECPTRMATPTEIEVSG